MSKYITDNLWNQFQAELDSDEGWTLDSKDDQLVIKTKTFPFSTLQAVKVTGGIVPYPPDIVANGELDISVRKVWYRLCKEIKYIEEPKDK
jgi:hypothetical protein